MSKMTNDHGILETEANYYIVGQSQAVASAVTTYENAISTYSNSLLENI